ncbi:membrane protein [Neptunitalea chrysea]|uniref:Membrane protein n=1 Tax=Neptunitalea chrysea TaxID=1647581 RepID=A0A9W6B5D2_9FLAO|nr:BamA/TamA family outer membrane protein [Neptunitalea chrysea]GLB52172.1 membrane protein [Neptunitalea chrysea]
MKTLLAKITVIVLLFLLGSCNVVKRVPNGELLLTKNTLIENNEPIKDINMEGLYYQNPNSNVLGFPLGLHIYNIAKPKSDSIYLARLDTTLKKNTLAENILSKKQLIEWTKTKINFQNWLRKTGEAPIIIQNLQTKKTSDKLKAYLYTKGYFNADVTYNIKPLENKKKKGKVDYILERGKPYYIDSISREVASPQIDSIFKRFKRNSFIKEGAQYNLENFQKERDRLTFIFRNSGIYNFQQNSIEYLILRDTVMEHKDYKMPVKLIINNYAERNGDSITQQEYKVHTIDKINIYADYSFSDNYYELDTINYNGYTIYYSKKLRYSLKTLTNVIAAKKGAIYRDIDRTNTYRQISNLNTFKYPNIDYTYEPTDSTQTKLINNIYLTPLKKFTAVLDVDLSHSNIQDFGISFMGSIISRNVFRGAETLKISGRSTFGSQKSAAENDRFFNISEIGADVKLNFPRIFFPLNTDKWITKSMIPTTVFSVGSSVQQNIGLDKRTLDGSLAYNWHPTSLKKVGLELLDIQYIKNVNIDNFFNVYQTTYSRLNDIAQDYDLDDTYLNESDNLSIPTGANSFITDALANQINVSSDDREDIRSINERKERLTDNNLIVASNITYTINSRRGLLDNNFYLFRTKFELAGNLLSLIANSANLEKTSDDKNLLFGVQYSQYAKTEFDYIKYFEVSRNKVLAFRGFFGVAIPFGNSTSIPFSRSYFAGGSNDNRGWQAYSLGPGSSGSVNDFNEANLKLSFNLEYRFPIAGSIKGALFADAGNIWNFLDNVEDDSSSFNSISSLGDIALASGIGLRYDFGFFVFRLDTGFKVYDPALAYNRRWLTNINFNNAVLNIGINYPF